MFGRTLALGALALSVNHTPPLFTDGERQAIVAYWGMSDRYVQSKGGWTPYEVRLTVEGSKWLWTYNKKRGLGKTAPTQDPGALAPNQKNWESWIDARIALDRWNAAAVARDANERLGIHKPDLAVDSPVDPGPIPEDLLLLAGETPNFAAAVQPAKYRVNFDDGQSFGFTDEVSCRPKYAYFRFPQGVSLSGTAMRDLGHDKIDGLCQAAGISVSQKKIMAAVSMLEGGFDSVNTYDTGFVSVGFIQFAALSSGGGSLGEVMLREKTDAPERFADDFHKFGLDVGANGLLVAIDPATGGELSGPQATQRIIDDKRLTAIFCRAGQLSPPFQIAQLEVAKDRFYPANDKVSVPCDGAILSGKVADIFKSEAGMATMMDRKINTGRIDPLASVLTAFARDYEIHSFEDFCKLEPQLIAAMKWRKDYLVDARLGQPAAGEAIQFRAGAGSRSGSRGGRGGNSNGGG